MKLYIFITCLTLIKINLFAQQLKITGIVTDTSNKAIQSATVLLKKNNGTILLYQFSDKNGFFKFNLDSSKEAENSFIEVSAIGFYLQNRKIEPEIVTYNFNLSTKYNYLEKVVVTSRQPIRSSGDTLKYDVRTFSSLEDRSIGDVINRIPGMNVDEDGSIYFNGKKINNLVIQNDDLMGGKYGLATKTISKDNIKSIEVIQHFQPISILKNKVFTDDIAVNLVLKNDKDIKGSGQGIIGIGKPDIITTTANSILLNYRIKMLNTIKYNNVGEDYKYENIDLAHSETDYQKYILSDAAKDIAPIPLKYYNRNNSFKISLNNLINFTDSTHLRVNFNYYKDRNDINYNSHSENILQNDTLIYNELHIFRKKPYNYSASIDILKNKFKYYFNNNLQLNLEGISSYGNSLFNSNSISQGVNSQIKNIRNKLLWIPNFFTNNVITLNLELSYINNPQTLIIDSGINKQLLNFNNEYKRFTQFLELPTWNYKFAVNYFVNNSKLIQQSYQFGIDNKYQLFNSNISLLQLNNLSNSYLGDSGNNINYYENKFYFNPIYFLINDKWRLNFTSPIIIQNIKYLQKDYLQVSHKYYTYLTPEIKGEYYLTGQKTIVFSYKHNYKIGNILNLYNNLIATNYLHFSKNNDLIQEGKIDNFLIQYKVNQNIKMLFYNIGVEYKLSHFNSVNSIQYINFIQNVIALPIDNHQNTYSIFMNISKYIFSLKTKLAGSVNYSRSQMNQIINEKFLPFETSSGIINFNLICKPIDQVSVKYDGALNILENSSKVISNNSININNNIKILNHAFSFVLSPIKIPIHFTLVGYFQKYIPSYSKGYHSFFSDIKIKYIVRKLKIDIDFNCDNIFDMKTFHYFNSNINQLNVLNYNLRGRQFVLKSTFNF